jgi:restriction system protein
MGVPTFQELFLPLLNIIRDGNEHTIKNVREDLALAFDLSDEDRNQELLYGRKKFDNRVGWARTYLVKAGCIESTGWSRFKITQRGLEVLNEGHESIDIKYLERFPEFQKFQEKNKQRKEKKQKVVESEQTPFEIFEGSYQEMHDALIEELLSQVKASSASFFEQLVLDVLVSMGYGGSRKDAAQAVGKSGDEGIDGIIKEDKLGLDIIYVQAKKWDYSVGRKEIQSFSGSLDGQRAKKGIFITTSQFSKQAWDFVSKIEKKIVLIDGVKLAEYMIENDVGVTTIQNYQIKRLDMDYFEQG